MAVPQPTYQTMGSPSLPQTTVNNNIMGWSGLMGAGKQPAVTGFDGKYQANDTWAWITRQQWDDYTKRFAPYENQMIGMTTYKNPQVVEQEVKKGIAAVDTSADAYNKMNQQYMSRYGAAIDPRAAQTTGRMSNFTKTAAIADAANRIRQRLLDQDREIALGMASSTVGQNTLNQK